MTTKLGRPMPRWNWLWLGPVFVLVLLSIERHTLPYGLRIVQLTWQRWDWGGLISPSADFCWTVVLASVFAPVYGFVHAIEVLSSPTASGRRYLQATLIIVGIVLLPFVTDALIWGSFPFTFDNAGVGHLRMIPFIPWPDAAFGTY